MLTNGMMTSEGCPMCGYRLWLESGGVHCLHCGWLGKKVTDNPRVPLKRVE